MKSFAFPQLQFSTSMKRIHLAQELEMLHPGGIYNQRHGTQTLNINLCQISFLELLIELLFLYIQKKGNDNLVRHKPKSAIENFLVLWC